MHMQFFWSAQVIWLLCARFVPFSSLFALPIEDENPFLFCKNYKKIIMLQNVNEKKTHDFIFFADISTFLSIRSASESKQKKTFYFHR